jgi:SPX domain protein involved in polyphosphate accumulation
MFVDSFNRRSIYRYERKFLIPGITVYDVESIVKLHPAIFSKIYSQRFVNNIYFDSINLTSYYDNVDGVTNRIKHRIRWYGELSGLIEKPTLELKRKNGYLGRKYLYPVHPFELNNHLNFQKILKILIESNVPRIIIERLKNFPPMLINRFSRRYFKSADGRYRITIDSNFLLYRFDRQYNSLLNKLTDDINVILELKYNQDFDRDADSITNYFPFRMTKSSKYVSGVEKLLTY